MDNRRTYRNYREKVRNFTSPYPTSRIFSKVKRLFSPASIWTSSDDKPNDTSSSEPTRTSIETVKPFKYPFNGSTIGSNPSTLRMPGSYDVKKSPNRVLSNFFQQKGDEPLTEVEYEGIVSLIEKSKSSTPSKPKSEPKQQYNTTLPEFNSAIYNTPYTQKVLKKSNNSTVSTPNYHPTYHSVNDSFSTIPSVKRVYQFSGLPSPYRTRIKAPSLNKTVKKPKTDHSKVENTFDTPTSTKLKSEPLKSETANSILSVLDGSQVKNEDKEKTNDIKRFSNPYSSGSTKRSKTSITSKDINKTLSFDKSEPLPVENSTTKPINGNKPDASKPEPSVKNSAKIDTVSTFGQQKVPEKSPELPQNNLPENVPQKKSFDFSFGKTEKPVTDSKTTQNNFNFGSTDTNKNITPTNKPSTFNFVPKAQDSFQFPQLSPINVALNRQKVEEYKVLFEF